MSRPTSAPKLPSEEVKSRVTLMELCVLSGFSTFGIQHRVKVGKLHAPDKDGLFHRAKALRELAKYPKQPGSKRGRKKKPITVAPGREPQPAEGEKGVEKDPTSLPADENAEGHDPDTRYRLAKARQEEIKLRDMRGETVELKEAKRRAFHIARMWRDRMDAAVSKGAPQLAAKLGIDEGKAYQVLRSFMRGLQEELAQLDVGKAIGEGIEEEEEADDEG